MMNGQTSSSNLSLAGKIARLVEERGWNQEDFARIANLNRQTVRQILHTGTRKLRNTTVSACARALGLPVLDLRTEPLERLLARMNGPANGAAPSPATGDVEQRYGMATQPELRAWMERNPTRAQNLTPDEIDELLSLQGTGGPLTSFGVEHFVELIERKKALTGKVQVIAGTEYLDLLEQMVDLMYDRIRPYRDKT